ncbi:MAG: toprim domain-containing protein [Pseudomonadota bacterium]
MTAHILDALRAAGLEPVKHDLVLDGRIHRYRVVGDRAGSMNGWYTGHLSPVASAIFGSWKTGQTETWRAEADKALSPAERAEHRRQFEAMRRQRAEEEVQVRESARAKAARLWALARPADAAHPYLMAKRVKAWGIRQLRESLVIPVRNVAGQLHSLQFIGADGDKRFLTGGRLKACYCPIGRPVDTLLLAEGYATAATVYEATGHATACAFNAGNLAPVARALRSKFPTLRIVICADNDIATPGNPGLTKAWEAARAVQGWVAVPTFESA